MTLMESLNNLKFFEYLEVKEANINLVDAEDNTVLIGPLIGCRKEIVSFLLTHKDINVNLKNE